MLHFPRWKIIAISLAALFFVLFSIPSFLSESGRAALPEWLPQRTVNLGLDLQGGSQLLLEIDFAAYEREQLSNLLEEIRRSLRDAKLGYTALKIEGDAVAFGLRSDMVFSDLQTLLYRQNPDIEVTIQGDRHQVRFREGWYTKSRDHLLAQSLQIVDRRVNEIGTKEPIIQRQGTNRILLQVPGLTDPEHLKRLLGRTAKMTFHLVDESVSPQDLAMGVVPSGTRIVSGDDRDEPATNTQRKFAVFSRVILSGDMLVDANASYDQQNGEPVVAFRFNATGARIFGEITSQNIGKPFAIVLDNKVITAPVIRSAIMGGSGIISGNFSTQSANDLALLLRAGALPAPLKVIEERSVGPSLGADSIAAGVKASLLAIVLVVTFMLLFYGMFGLFANIAMIINSFMILSILAMFGATLTLPGIAGIVLTIGMAVDANVLIYERMREELRGGVGVFKAVENGFRMAFATIFDSHVTGFLAALILFIFGTGTVKGFAVTLAVGIVCSLFTAVLVTRMMVVLWLQRVRPKTLTL